jgi:ribonuclease BN (tRNA processing enzyme)
LIHDAQYTQEEYPSKITWGHTSMEYAVEAALKANVKCLALFHHDPNRSDDELDVLVKNLKKYSQTIVPNNNLVIFAAYEGLELNL